jgi:hypothetical protein
MEGAQLRFTLPTIVAPRFDPTLNNPFDKTQETQYDIKGSEYKLNASFNLQMSSEIIKITSPSHPKQLLFTKDPKDSTKGISQFGNEHLHQNHLSIYFSRVSP